MKKQKKLLALALAVVVLFGAYAALRALTAAQDETGAAGALTLKPFTEDMLEPMILQSSAGDWKLVKSADGAWQWADDADFPLTQSYVDTMLEQVTALQVTGKVLDDAGAANAADYGLDAPQNVITVTTAGAAGVVFTLGDTNTHTGDTYLTVSGDPALYTVGPTFLQAFSYDLYGMITLEQWPVTVATQITSVSVRRGAQELRLDVAETDGSKTYTVTENGAAHAANSEAGLGLLEDVAALSVDGCSSYKADDASLAEYGLQEPAAVITVNWTDAQGEAQSVTLQVGLGDDAATYFTRMEGSAAVNIMDGEVVAAVLNATAANLQSAPATE